MNTRRGLRRILENAGFRECYFTYLDDCRAFGRWRIPNTLEMCVWKTLHTFGLHYLETCLLGVCERTRN